MIAANSEIVSDESDNDAWEEIPLNLFKIYNYPRNNGWNIIAFVIYIFLY